LGAAAFDERVAVAFDGEGVFADIDPPDVPRQSLAQSKFIS
jgi:hypothetical protein